ncbi:hypothetical protein [Paracoccus sp. JM45]|uniref:hypothetical protein n=1 Tax=Paracoccus sp. JM45 TaxID=2283626 RepID=UPI0016024641|nr:hypothetical protein [Paracoccus sp. JM45]
MAKQLASNNCIYLQDDTLLPRLIEAFGHRLEIGRGCRKMPSNMRYTRERKRFKYIKVIKASKAICCIIGVNLSFNIHNKNYIFAAK